MSSSRINVSSLTEHDPRNHTNEDEDFSEISCDFVDRVLDPRLGAP